jgi:hypothetical protein
MVIERSDIASFELSQTSRYGDAMSAPSQWKPIGSAIAPTYSRLLVPRNRDGRLSVINAGDDVAGERTSHV